MSERHTAEWYTEQGLLTDAQYKHCIPCWCNSCGTQLWRHMLHPRVAPRSLEHACVARPQPIGVNVQVLEVRPMGMPKSLLFYEEYGYGK